MYAVVRCVKTCVPCLACRLSSLRAFRKYMRRAVSLAVLALGALLCAVPAAADAPWEVAKFAVFGYLPEYRLHNFNYRAAFQSGLTHLIFFSLEIGEDSLPAALDRLPSKEAAAVARREADAVGGKVLISFGGNARSQNFGDMATRPRARAKYLAALEQLMIDYQFDGVDYNWEYPANHGEWRAWGTLMKETKKLLGGKAIVTFTMYLDPNHYEIIKRYDLLKDADYVHCMAYDQPRQHSTFAFFRSGIRLAREKRFDLGKFTMGLPFYSRDVTNGMPKTYAELQPHLENDVDDQHRNDYFNSRATIAKKTRSAAEDVIGGVMIWEIGQDVQPMDDQRSLMTGLKSALPWKVPTGGDASATSTPARAADSDTRDDSTPDEL